MTSPVTKPQLTPLLCVESVHVAYVKKEILRGVSLTVNQGEIVALLGGNGSGKSTLLKTIAGLLQPTKGRIEFNGQDITQLSVHGRQKGGIGYLLQGGRVFPNLSVEENFEIARKHHRNGRNTLRDVLGSIFPQLREKANVRAGLLSGGQRQMLAIEMVLTQEPALALLDEPTGALSHDLAATILRTAGEFVKRSGCGVLLVEQNVEEASRVSHRRLRLQEGSITESLSVTSGSQPAVANDENNCGSVTAGNSSGINDGAASTIVVSEAVIKKHNLKPLARVVAMATAGVEPSIMGIGPIFAVRKALDRAGLKVSDIGLVELNEAFASQSIACMRDLGFDPSIVNVNGGAIAIGHPLGCSGARITATLLHEMKRRADVKYGVATMCIGVGQGLAVVYEKI